ncbi:conserved hypothetical protein [Sphingomonas aurantiaca]|uniref:Uncharacterized protein n=1 Tax=Sphingomonas aurantiaca TaxID=185949 RepID=A0A5E7ZQL8_9SPHN|nr:hypothetical protein [Sphingomonas aurantiaca]VVT21492.1 conserved hypothetical protein [Sphingomonas aurantiaca]
MTQNTKLAAIANEIETYNAQLIKIRALVDLIGKPAILKADEVVKALNDAKERFADALANQATVERAERIKDFSGIRVVTKLGNNLLDTTFIIHYTRNTWDMKLNESVPIEHECSGFAQLDDAAYEYLVTVKPQAIPAAIMELAPGNPQDAFGAYFMAQKRGYIKGAAVTA